MTDLASFFRYIIPGATGLIIFFIGAWVGNSSIVTNLVGVDSIQVLGGALFASIIGYFLSRVHRLFQPFHGLDHTSVVNYLLKRGCVIVVNSSNENEVLECITGTSANNKMDAYQITNVLWHQNRKYFDDKKTDAYADVLNSFGATITAVIIAFCVVLMIGICSLCSASGNPDWCTVIFYTVFVGLFLTMLIWAKKRTTRMYQVWFESSLVSVFRLKSGADFRPKDDPEKLNSNVHFFRFESDLNAGLKFKPASLRG